MSIEHFIIGILTVFLLGQQVYWSLMCSNLVNKIMSRDYQGYVQAGRKPESHQPISSEDLGDPIADRQAQELNAIIGIV